MREERYSISEVARFFGLRVSTLRYYDDLGLVAPAERRGTVRFYGREQLRQLALVRRLHREGMMSLVDTGKLVGDQPAVDEVSSRELMSGTVVSISRRIDELTRAKAVLEHLLSCPRPDPARHCEYFQADLDGIIDEAIAGSTPAP